MAENAGKYKILKSKVAVGKANCTKAMGKLEQTFDAYNKNKGTEVPMTRPHIQKPLQPAAMLQGHSQTPGPMNI